MIELFERLEIQAARITGKIASLGVLLMLCIAVLTLVDILLRWLASASVPGFNEIVQLCMAVAIAATFPAGASSRVNLTIDILERKVSREARRVFDALGSLLLLLLFSLLAKYVGIHALHLQSRGAISLFLEIPQAPFLFAVTLFFALATGVQLIIFLRDFSVAYLGVGGKEKHIGMAAIITLSFFAGFVLAIAKLIALFSPTAFDHIGFWVVTFFVLLWVLILGFVPVAAATALIGLIGTALFLGNDPALIVLGSEAAGYLGKVELTVLPLFLLMGGFAAQAGLASDIYRLTHILMSRFRGGLAMATIGGCAGFGALTGSSIATAATIGQVALPEMRKRGYSPGLAAGCVAAGGTLGALIPPSTLIILYAILTEESIGQLFIAAVIPAFLAILAYLVTIGIVVSVSPNIAPSNEEKISVGEVAAAIKGAMGILMFFVIVVGGLYSGIFTATESAAVGVFGAFLFALMRGKLKGKEIWQVMAKSTAMTAMIFLLIIGASNLSFFIAISGLPGIVTSFLQGLDVAPLLIICLFLCIYILLGAVLNPFAIMIITVPIVAPVVGDMGYSLIWWGIVMVAVVETGMITPPFGINVFVLKNIAGGDVPLSTIFKGVLPFVLADLFKLALLVLFPVLVLWLPSTM